MLTFSTLLVVLFHLLVRKWFDNDNACVFSPRWHLASLRGDKRIVAHQKCLNYKANVLFNLDTYSYTLICLIGRMVRLMSDTTAIVISVMERLLLVSNELLMELIFDFIFKSGSLPGNVALLFSFEQTQSIDSPYYNRDESSSFCCIVSQFVWNQLSFCYALFDDNITFLFKK